MKRNEYIKAIIYGYQSYILKCVQNAKLNKYDNEMLLNGIKTLQEAINFINEVEGLFLGEEEIEINEVLNE